MSDGEWKSLGYILEKELAPEEIGDRPPRLKTGFDQLDRHLGGGISNGLIVLGGVPGLGKSTFALQLAEQAAELSPKKPVLYFSLEMPGERIGAKAASRRYFKEFRETEGKGRITADDLINSERLKKLPEDISRRVSAIRMEQARLLTRFYVFEQLLSVGKIADKVSRFREEHPALDAPLVVVDYLQILPPENTKAGSDKQKVEDSLRKIVELAHSGLPVILISSLNRGSYLRPIQMDSFKESGGIEYSADVLLGLQFCACHEKDGGWDLNEEKNKSPRSVEVSILKQRYGSSGDVVPFRYYAEYDCFEECAPGAAAPPAAAAKAVPAAAAGAETVPAPEAAAKKSPRAERKKNEEVYYINNTLVANRIRKGGTDGNCAVFGRQNKSVTTMYSLSDSLTAYDCDVADALYTLYHADQREFNLGRVLKVLTGDGKQTVTAQKRAELTASIERLRNTSITIDCAAEREQRDKGGRGGDPFLKGRFLSVQEMGGGRYRFDGDAPMPLYTYGEQAGQMIAFPAYRLTVYNEGRKLSDTADNISLKRFLIRRIEVVSYQSSTAGSADPARSRMKQISFQKEGDLLKELRPRRAEYQSKAAWNAKLQKLRETAVAILRYYKDTGYLIDFQETSSGVTLTV